jgi:hypothetical protein
MKFDRHQRALVRALSKRAKWDAKEIAAVFRVSLVIIQKTITNAYVAVTDIVSEDENYYNESEFEKLLVKVSLRNYTAAFDLTYHIRSDRCPSAPRRKRRAEKNR